jgi:hypothetical protein
MATFIVWLLKFTLKILNLKFVVLSFNFRLIMLSGLSENWCRVFYDIRFAAVFLFKAESSEFIHCDKRFRCSGKQWWNWHSRIAFIKVSDSPWTSMTFCKLYLTVATSPSKARRNHKGPVRQVMMARPQSCFLKPKIAVRTKRCAQALCLVDREISVSAIIYEVFPWDVAETPGSETV